MHDREVGETGQNFMCLCHGCGLSHRFHGKLPQLGQFPNTCLIILLPLKKTGSENLESTELREIREIWFYTGFLVQVKPSLVRAPKRANMWKGLKKLKADFHVIQHSQSWAFIQKNSKQDFEKMSPLLHGCSTATNKMWKWSKWPSADKWTKKVICTDSGILLSLEKEGNCTIYDKMD